MVVRAAGPRSSSKRGKGKKLEQVPLLVLEDRCSKYVKDGLKNRVDSEGKTNVLLLNVSNVVEARRVGFFTQIKLILGRCIL